MVLLTRSKPMIVIRARVYKSLPASLLLMLNGSLMHRWRRLVTQKRGHGMHKYAGVSRTWKCQTCSGFSWFLALLLAQTHGHTHRSAPSGVFRTVLWPRHQRPNRIKTLLSNQACFMLSARKLHRRDFFCLNECTHTHICVDRPVLCVFPCARLCVFHRQAVCRPSCLPNYEVFVYPQNDDDRCFTFIFTHDTYSTIQSDMYNIWQSSICKNIWEKKLLNKNKTIDESYQRM